jgi:hypothetical protein
MTIFAYVDPGLGLLAWQAVTAFFVGLLFYVRKTRKFIFSGARKMLGWRKSQSLDTRPSASVSTPGEQ